MHYKTSVNIWNLSATNSLNRLRWQYIPKKDFTRSANMDCWAALAISGQCHRTSLTLMMSYSSIILKQIHTLLRMGAVSSEMRPVLRSQPTNAHTRNNLNVAPTVASNTPPCRHCFANLPEEIPDDWFTVNVKTKGKGQCMVPTLRHSQILYLAACLSDDEYDRSYCCSNHD